MDSASSLLLLINHLSEVHQNLVARCEVRFSSSRTIFNLKTEKLEMFQDLVRAEEAIAQAIASSGLPDCFAFYLNGKPQRVYSTETALRKQKIRLANLKKLIDG